MTVNINDLISYSNALICSYLVFSRYIKLTRTDGMHQLMPVHIFGLVLAPEIGPS